MASELAQAQKQRILQGAPAAAAAGAAAGTGAAVPPPTAPSAEPAAAAPAATAPSAAPALGPEAAAEAGPAAGAEGPAAEREVPPAAAAELAAAEEAAVERPVAAAEAVGKELGAEAVMEEEGERKVRLCRLSGWGWVLQQMVEPFEVDAQCVHSFGFGLDCSCYLLHCSNAVCCHKPLTQGIAAPAVGGNNLCCRP